MLLLCCLTQTVYGFFATIEILKVLTWMRRRAVGCSNLLDHLSSISEDANPNFMPVCFCRDILYLPFS
jgi:hypothetical protein